MEEDTVSVPSSNDVVAASVPNPVISALWEHIHENQRSERKMPSGVHFSKSNKS